MSWCRCSVRTLLHRQSTPGVLDSGPEAAGPVHRSHDQQSRITTELLIAFTEASGDTAANASHDVILQHSDARSQSVVAVVLNRNFSLQYGSVNRFESIFPITNADAGNLTPQPVSF